MKKTTCLAVCLIALNLAPAFGQQAGTFVIANSQKSVPNPALIKFNLDFPGGTPAELVKAIEKATGKPLNAIIPTDDADVQLPPLKMNDVDVAQLFVALEDASGSQVTHNGPYGNTVHNYGFGTTGTLSNNSIWHFYANKPSLPSPPAKICRFYPLALYLERGFTVDDITTAIQTGWKMAGVNPPPELDYHKETKLLIAYGEPSQLLTIDNVLQSLPATNATRNELDKLKDRVAAIPNLLDEVRNLRITCRNLETEMDRLTKANSDSASKPATAPAEKSGQ